LKKALGWLLRANSNHAIAVGTVVAAIAAIFYTCSANRQLAVMQATLREMHTGSQTSTEQIWRAVDNLNWMASTMAWSQKQTEESMTNTLAEMRRQTSAQAQQLALSARQEQRAVTERAAHLIIENFDVVYSTNNSKTTVVFDLFNDGNSTAKSITMTEGNGGYDPTRTNEDNLADSRSVPKELNTRTSFDLPAKSIPRHYELDASDWGQIRNSPHPMEWLGWKRFTYSNGIGDKCSICIGAIGSKHGVYRKPCLEPPMQPPNCQ
jgi:hypothetical protein